MPLKGNKQGCWWLLGRQKHYDLRKSQLTHVRFLPCYFAFFLSRFAFNSNIYVYEQYLSYYSWPPTAKLHSTQSSPPSRPSYHRFLVAGKIEIPALPSLSASEGHTVKKTLQVTALPLSIFGKVFKKTRFQRGSSLQSGGSGSLWAVTCSHAHHRCLRPGIRYIFIRCQFP